jgi:hypothetical protein
MNAEMLPSACDAMRRARAVAEFADWQVVLYQHAERVAQIDRSDDGVRVTAIARAAEQLQSPESWDRLQHSAPAYAANHFVAGLRAWLRRLRRRLEPEGADTELPSLSRTAGSTSPTNDDGTSWLNALLPPALRSWSVSGSASPPSPFPWSIQRPVRGTAALGNRSGPRSRSASPRPT